MGGGFGYLWFVLSSQALSTARLVQFTAASLPIWSIGCLVKSMFSYR